MGASGQQSALRDLLFACCAGLSHTFWCCWCCGCCCWFCCLPSFFFIVVLVSTVTTIQHILHPVSSKHLLDKYFQCVSICFEQPDNWSILRGCINVLLTNPLWVVNQRLKMTGLDPSTPRWFFEPFFICRLSRYRGLLDGLGKIWVQEGVAALWNGTKASLMLVSNPAIKFTM